MATGNNDYLPIATSGSAPVQSQAEYISSVPANGRGAGILPKEVFNKMLRQASSMVAAIGKFISDAGFNANDDGNIPALEAAFIAALETQGIQISAFTGAGKQQLAGDGWQYLPGGLLIQWVHGSVSGPTSTTVPWPIAFPASCFGAVISSNGSFKPTTPPGIISTTLTNCVIDCESSSDSPDCFIIALGR